MDPKALAKRCSALRLPQNELARLARVGKDTVGSVLKERHHSRLDTLRKLGAAVDAEELRLLAALVKQHPERAAALIGAQP